MTDFQFHPIGYIRSCFREKFGVPRQPGLVSEARAVLEMVAPFNQAEAFRGLETFSHIWLVFVFHANGHRDWKATIRPPRLGGNRRVGVFASRSGFRPNPIGQSVVPLLGIDSTDGAMQLQLGGVDLLDGTPVLDIKPYLPYADCIGHATGGYAGQAPASGLSVRYAPRAAALCDSLDPDSYPQLQRLITALLTQDPRPAYQVGGTRETYGMRLWDLNIRFRISKDEVVVEDILPQCAGNLTS